MIKANEKQIMRYAALSPIISKIDALIKGTEWNKIDYGKYDAFSGIVYYQYGEYMHHVENDYYEAHRMYADLHYLISGDEIINTASIESLHDSIPYDSERDTQILIGEGHGVHLQSGEWILLFPEDAHSPAIKWKTGKSIKLIFKIPMDLFE